METPEHATAAALVSAIQAGDINAVQRIVAGTPELVTGPLGGPFKARTALHVVADWPGYFPNGPQVVRLLVAAGADPSARNPGDESPLHWAASSDDADVAAALIDAGADIEAPDGSIGTPLDNAIGYACWHVARLLAARGARVDKLWHAAALGMLDRLQHLIDTADPTSQDVSQAFWHACSAGQRRTAEHLLSLGADLNWVPDYAEGTPLDAASGRGTRRDNVISWLEEQGGRSAAASERAGEAS
ncbi:ankyrin repeat domain-containing protein [Streptomyces sp. NPDC093676]|uniref:ankyrin repeat domain-containing protein n=1 Tax=Streptomyces sp. NPDC093676 TaxID=3366050 RepID=UPI0038212615